VFAVISIGYVFIVALQARISLALARTRGKRCLDYVSSSGIFTWIRVEVVEVLEVLELLELLETFLRVFQTL
jgi:hypothetical protein